LKQLKHPGRRLQEHAQTLDMLEGRMLRATRQHLTSASRDLQELQRRLHARSPAHTLQQLNNQLETTLQRLHRGMLQRLSSQQAQIAQLARSLDGVSPLNTLQRGYSISFDSKGQVVRELRAVQVGDSLTTRLADGSISSVVTGQTPGKIGSSVSE